LRLRGRAGLGLRHRARRGRGIRADRFDRRLLQIGVARRQRAQRVGDAGGKVRHQSGFGARGHSADGRQQDSQRDDVSLHVLKPPSFDPASGSNLTFVKQRCEAENRSKDLGKRADGPIRAVRKKEGRPGLADRGGLVRVSGATS
jgi:hypothetical protein